MPLIGSVSVFRHAKVARGVAAVFAFLLWGCAGLSGCAAPGSSPAASALAQATTPATSPITVLRVDASARQALAPTGTLRVGVYPGSPTSLVKAADGTPAGVAHDLGHLLARDLGVPVRVIEFARLAQVLEALKAGQIDFTFTNATESRAREMDFTAPLVRLELGYLVPAGSRIERIDDIDRAGIRVGVAQGSTSQTLLGARLTQASVVGAPSLDAARTMLADGRLDTFATNKGILNELSDTLSGARILDGRWGMETMAVAIPKGRDAARPWLQTWADTIAVDGRLRAAVQRSGLRGLANDRN